MTDRRPPPPLPLSVLTGFLGSGKTTLLNGLLRHEGMANTAVIINEFGEIGLDHLLVESSSDGVMELASGCLCCTIRGELIDTLENLLRKRDNGRIKPFDRVVIQTTGLADPAPVLHTVMVHPYLAVRFRLSGVITTIDAVNAAATLDVQEEAVKQAAVADRLVLTKTDLVDDGDAVQSLCARLAALNPGAPLLRAVDGEAVPERLFDAGLYDPARKTLDVRRWLNEEAYRTAHDHTAHAHSHDHHHDHHDHVHDVNRHDARIQAFSVSTDEPIAYAALEMLLDLLRGTYGDNLLRLKGIICLKEDPDHPIAVHGVQQIFHPPARLEAWPDGDRRTRLVIIARDADPAHVADLLDAFSGKPKPDMAGPDVYADNPLSLRS